MGQEKAIDYSKCDGAYDSKHDFGFYKEGIMCHNCGRYFEHKGNPKVVKDGGQP